MAHINAEIVALQNSDNFSDTEPLDPWLCLDECDPDDGAVEIFEGALPDPDAPVVPQPTPTDLILAARDVIAAFGGNVPDWLRDEIGMLELALKPFASCQPPLPPADSEPQCPKCKGLGADPESGTDCSMCFGGGTLGPYTSEDILARYDDGELNDEQAIAELEKRGWAERRARVILEQHIAS
jgi:hypothetical protein